MKLAGLVFFLALASLPAVDYPLTEDSKPHDGVPKGDVLKLTFDKSSIFPGTTRSVSVYVPKQYDPAKPACVWVNQDGIQHHAPVVFDNLIAKGEMPVTIYIAASPGVVKALDGKTALDRFNRSLEYDGLGDAYARFVLEELLPFVEKQKTADGRAIVLSKNGNDRCIGGSSSGAVCAFTAAWEKPAAFRRVFSTIGTYVGLRGADVYPTLIRKVEPKPLRVFLQDGSNDQNIYGGDWWMANQMMERALKWAGYEVEHAWGEEGHNAKQGDAIFPDAVRWIWKDWPREPKAGMPKSGMLPEILLPGEGWETVGEKYRIDKDLTAGLPGEVNPYGMASNPKGEVVVGLKMQAFKVSVDGIMRPWNEGAKLGEDMAFGPDGSLFSTQAAGKQTMNLVVRSASGSEKVVAEGLGGSIVVGANGGAYVMNSRLIFTTPLVGGWYLPPEGKAAMAVEPRAMFGSVTLSTDQSLLYVVNEHHGNRVLSYRIQADGTLEGAEQYFHLHANLTDGQVAAKGLGVDRDGRLYVGTGMGIQICDQAGRVNAILPLGQLKIRGLCFGGPKFDTLYVMGDEHIYRRKLKVQGAPAFLPPVLPKGPRL